VSGSSQEIDGIDRAIAQCKDLVGALLPALHAIQDALGYVPEAAIPRLADALKLSRAEVVGTLSFYHDFRTKPPGRHVLKVCRAEACQAMGGNALAEHVKERLGCDFKGTTPGGDVTLDEVYCLGNCACAPAVMIDGVLHGRVTRERFDVLAKTELA
jgi:formate dehydrogenase subunit gamma